MTQELGNTKSPVTIRENTIFRWLLRAILLFSEHVPLRSSLINLTHGASQALGTLLSAFHIAFSFSFHLNCITILKGEVLQLPTTDRWKHLDTEKLRVFQWPYSSQVTQVDMKPGKLLKDWALNHHATVSWLRK